MYDGKAPALQGLRAFVINLVHDVERRAHMEKQLSTLGLDAEFVPAVDGRSLDAEALVAYDRTRCLRVYGVEMMPNEIGCYVSHYRLYERMVREGIAVALIMEDDLEIDPRFPRALAALLEEERPPWHIVRFETQRGRVAAPKSRKDRGTLVRPLGETELFQLKIHVLGLGAYLIRLDGARRMVAFGRRIFMPIDQAMDRFWENGIEPYFVRPQLVRQRPTLASRIGTRDYSRRTDVPAWAKVARRCQRIMDSINKRLYWWRY